MSLTGKSTMGVLRIIKPGKGSFSDLEKMKKKARNVCQRRGYRNSRKERSR